MVDFKELYEGSAYTIEGAGGDLNEWKEGYSDLLNKQNIGKIKKWYTFKGKDMNKEFGLTGSNAYPDDLTFLAFSLDGLDIGKLAMFKLKMHDRWFDDIVDNNARREGYHGFNTAKELAKSDVKRYKKHKSAISQLENSVRRMF